MVRREPRQSPLSGWLLDQVAPGGPFRSVRELAVAAGLNQNTVNLIIERGRGEPETLLKLAKATGARPIDLFARVGWLSPEDTAGVPFSPLTPREQAHLTTYRLLSDDAQKVIDETISLMLGSPKRTEPSSRDPIIGWWLPPDQRTSYGLTPGQQALYWEYFQPMHRGPC